MSEMQTTAELAATLKTAQRQLDRALARCATLTTGAAVRVRAIDEILAALEIEQSVWIAAPSVVAGDFLDVAAQELIGRAFGAQQHRLDQRLDYWRGQREFWAKRADEIERRAAPAFADDGMEWVPGRGRVRRSKVNDRQGVETKT